MTRPNAASFYDAYHNATANSPRPERDDGWLRCFGEMADTIVADIRPVTVLDAACASGLLVETLRARGVQATGIDASAHAIRNVHPSIQPYCRVASLTEALPQRYDLIVCIEALGYVTPALAEQAIAIFCAHTEDILFSSTPFDRAKADGFSSQPPEDWAERFARHGFCRDVDFDASFIAPWAARFRKTREPMTRVIGSYERRWWQLEQECQARREANIKLRGELVAKEHELQLLRAQRREMDAELRGREDQWTRLQRSPGGTLLRALQAGRARLAPPGSTRDQALEEVWHGLRTRQPRAFVRAVQRFGQDISRRAKALRVKGRPSVDRTVIGGRHLVVEAIVPRAALQVHQASAEIIVCVHDALADVQRCLESVVQHTTAPYGLILVDDGSAAATRDYLAAFSAQHEAVLLRNEQALGYTFAANQGLRHTTADYVILLNSDTIVTPEWLDRLIACARSGPQIGLVGPLSNTASWQSIPEIENQGDWAANPLPPGMSVEEMGRLVARFSARLYPEMPLLNGFCLLLRRELIQEIGYFDEESFGAGYGEEDDYTLRARRAGWSLALADDVYVYHAQSRSYSDEQRKALCDRAGVILAQKHGQHIIDESVAFCRQDRVLAGIRARSRAMLARKEWVDKGRARYAGYRVLFLLPISEPGGGGNVILSEARAMREMGVEVVVFNLTINRPGFEGSYPDLELPVIYGAPEDIVFLADEYDAVIATVNYTPAWLAPITQRHGRPVRGYYVQGFEPLIYEPDSEDYQRALDSYTLFPDLVLFTKTDWTRREVVRHTQAECALIGVSMDVDLFRPRPRPESLMRPLRIAAMVRPSTPYREPELTMQVLRQAAQSYGSGVEIVTFGAENDDPRLGQLAQGFSWQAAGMLSPDKVAALLNEADIFVDYSSHQAMGLTALEAMACGAAVIVPQRGGATSFVRDGENGLVVDTSSAEACWRALQRLIDDRDLRTRLQANALVDVCEFYPERPAHYILDALFDSMDHGEDR